MPIRPAPFVLVCNQCHWSKTFAPRSDCLIKGLDYVEQCPVCGCRELNRKEPTTSDLLIMKLKQILKP